MMKFIKQHKIILTLLLLGLVFRLLITSEGNFIFHMDSARDFIDVREMVELKKPRLIGPTSAINGVYTGPAWYYLLAIPYLISSGNPYGGILMEIILWIIGGFFLLKITSHYGKLSTISSGLLWGFAPYIVLLTQYTFNPNPVTLLFPVWIYLLYQYLRDKKLIFSFLLFTLTGVFFNFEMNVGFLLPAIILVSIIIFDIKLLTTKGFWIGILGFLICLIPQILFNLKHQNMMFKSLLNFLSQSGSNTTNYSIKFFELLQNYTNQINAALFNQPLLTLAFKYLTALLLIKLIYTKSLKKDLYQLIIFSIFITSLLIYLILPVTVNAWHLGFIVVSGILTISFLMSHFKILSIPATFFIIYLSTLAVINFFQHDYNQASTDPSNFKNEIKVIDYIYQKAGDRNFRVYTHIPSVYDYPYQYLIWWYGKNKYGYLPKEYTYLPDKPIYIPAQSKFQNTISKSDSNLVFLVEELQNPKLLDLWLNNFNNYPSLDSVMIGPIRVETRLLPIQPFLSLGS